MAVKVYLKEGNPIIYADASSVEISSTGVIRVYSDHRPALNLGGVASDRWTHYEVTSDTSNDGNPMPSEPF